MGLFILSLLLNSIRYLKYYVFYCFGSQRWIFLKKKNDKHKACDVLISHLFICVTLFSPEVFVFLSEMFEFLYIKGINPLFKKLPQDWCLLLNIMCNVLRSGEHFISIEWVRKDKRNGANHEEKSDISGCINILLVYISQSSLLAPRQSSAEQRGRDMQRRVEERSKHLPLTLSEQLEY